MLITDTSDRIIDSDDLRRNPMVRSALVPVVDVLNMLRAGMTEAEILHKVPALEADDIRASVSYAIEGLTLLGLVSHSNPIVEAAIDRGWDDSKAGRVVSLEEGIGQLRAKWTARAASVAN